MEKTTQEKINRQVKIIGVVIVGMFGFCFALVPLYNVFCTYTGLGGRTDGVIQTQEYPVDATRQVTVELLSVLNENMPGLFKSKEVNKTLYPGQIVSTSYRVKNMTDKPMVVQAIPSVTPGYAAKHIKKYECFCFAHQALEPNEEKDFPLQFTVTPDLPEDIKTISLSYTLFDITES